MQDRRSIRHWFIHSIDMFVTLIRFCFSFIASRFPTLSLVLTSFSPARSSRCSCVSQAITLIATIFRDVLYSLAFFIIFFTLVYVQRKTNSRIVRNAYGDYKPILRTLGADGVGKKTGSRCEKKAHSLALLWSYRFLTLFSARQSIVRKQGSLIISWLFQDKEIGHTSWEGGNRRKEHKHSLIKAKRRCKMRGSSASKNRNHQNWRNFSDNIRLDWKELSTMRNTDNK